METQNVEHAIFRDCFFNLQGPHHGQIDFIWMTSNKLSIRQVKTILEFHCQASHVTKPVPTV